MGGEQYLGDFDLVDKSSVISSKADSQPVDEAAHL